MKTTSILAIILSVGLIGFSVYTINHYSKSSNPQTSKIVVWILGVIFILSAIAGIWSGIRTLRQA